MELLSIIIIGFCIGFLIVVSPGIVMLLAIRLLFSNRYKAFISLVCGAMAGDSFFLFLAAIGSVQILEIIEDYKIYFNGLSFLLLFFASILLYFKPVNTSNEKLAPESNTAIIGYFSSSFFLVITNPFTITTIILLLTMVSNFAYTPHTNIDAIIFSLSGITGGFTWWVIAYFLARLLGQKSTAYYLGTLNKMLSRLIFCFSLYPLYQIIAELTA